MTASVAIKRRRYLTTMLKSLKYKDGWTLRYREPTREESACGWDGFVEITSPWVKDTCQDGANAASNRDVPIGALDEIPSVVNAVYECILAMEIHEAQEWFEFGGQRLFYPHRFPVDKPAAMTADAALRRAR